MDERDAQLKRNFDLIGQRVPLPPDPDVRQIERWISAQPKSAANRSIEHSGVRNMIRKWWLPSSAGIAAAVAFGVMLLNPSARTANAATVFDKLRGAIDRSQVARIEYRNIVWKDFTLDLTATIQRHGDNQPQSIHIASKADDGEFRFDEPGMTIQWNMRGSSHEDLFVSTPAGAWGWLRLPRVAADFFKLNPQAEAQRPLIEAAAQGVYVDELQKLGEKAVFFSGNLNVLALADRANFRAIVDRIEADAESINVETRGDGTIWMEASDFKSGAGEIFRTFTWEGRKDKMIDTVMQKAVLEVRLKAGGDVERVRVRNLGDRNGEIDIAFDRYVPNFDPQMFDLSHNQQTRPGTTISGTKLRELTGRP